MYDARSEPHEFVAERREEAVEKACRFFGLEVDQLEIQEFAAGEVFGAAGRTVVVAVPRDRAPRRSSRGEGAAEERRGPPREERGGRERAGRGREERGRRERGSRGREEPARPAPRAAEPPAEPSVGTARGELGEVGRFLLGAIERMDLGPFEISEARDGELLVCELRGTAAEALASGDGRAVDALQLLANQVSMRQEGEPQRVVLDVEGDAEARESLLAGLAERAARRARETGRAVALDPMNGRDRRMVHVALRDQEDIATMSVGEGRYRQVVVVPEGAPEFEKARREAEEAAARSGS